MIQDVKNTYLFFVDKHCFLTTTKVLRVRIKLGKLHYSENGIPAFRIQPREIIESSTQDTVHLSSSMVISLQRDQRGVYGRWRDQLHCVVKRPQGTGGFLSASSQAATPAQLPMTKCTADDAHDRRRSSIQPARGAFFPHSTSALDSAKPHLRFPSSSSHCYLPCWRTVYSSLYLTTSTAGSPGRSSTCI